MRLRVKVRNPMWKFRHTYATYMIPHIREFETYEGDLVKVKKNWRIPTGEFWLVNGRKTHILNIEDVVEAWVQK